jgi:YegS/Rv2252/BmrU family lipid kinase
MNTSKWLLIANPRSGKGKGKNDCRSVQSMLSQKGIETDIAFSEYAGHTPLLAIQAIENGYRKLISMGGDGTLNEVVNGIFSQHKISPKEITLAAIPVGTGNDWCKTYKIKPTYTDAVNTIAAGKSIQHDIGVAEFGNTKKRYFINIAGTAYDGFVTKKTNELKEKGGGGKLFYLLSILYYLFQYKNTQVGYKIDDKEFSAEEIFTFSVCICRFNGDGMMQSPTALPDDGLLNITIIKKISKLKSILSLPRMKSGTFVNMKEVETYTGKNIEVTSSPQVLVETDGESVGETPVKFSIIHNALNVIINQYP